MFIDTLSKIDSPIKEEREHAHKHLDSFFLSQES